MKGRGESDEKWVSPSLVERDDETVAACDDMVAQFGASNPAEREQAVKELVKKAGELADHGEYRKAITIYDYVDARFGTPSKDEPALRELVARALIEKGRTFGSLFRSRETISHMEI